MREHIELGILDGRRQYLYKHDWACNWYWSFGWVGNNKEHSHFKSIFLSNTKSLSETLQSPKFSDEDFWVLRDFYKQAYALQAAAEVYQYAGNQSSERNIVGFLKNAEMAAMLNAHLKTILDTAWDFATDPADFRKRWDSAKKKTPFKGWFRKAFAEAFVENWPVSKGSGWWNAEKAIPFGTPVKEDKENP